METLSLSVNNREITEFESITVTSNLYDAADAWSAQLTAAAPNVEPGEQVKVVVNGKMEMTGLVDKETRSYEKGGMRVAISGRDMMGVLVDHYCEEFGTAGSLEGYTLKKIADQIMKDVPFSLLKKITYKNGAERLDRPYEMVHIEPGRTVFDVLNTYAVSRGFMFYCEPDGSLVFDKPATASIETSRRIVCRRDGSGNNVLSGERSRDISGAYSKVTVSGQTESWQDGILKQTVNVKGSAAMAVPAEFPFNKPYLAQRNKDHIPPVAEARHVLDAMRSKMFTLSYTLPGFSQGGNNWNCNQFCWVHDEPLGVHGIYLIYERTFRLDKDGGCSTSIQLGMPGLTA